VLLFEFGNSFYSSFYSVCISFLVRLKKHLSSYSVIVLEDYTSFFLIHTRHAVTVKHETTRQGRVYGSRLQ